MAKWKKVEDALPEVGEDVLVYAVGRQNRDDYAYAITRRAKYSIFSTRVERWRSPWEYFHEEYEITHWMPLPKKPDEEMDDVHMDEG